MIVRAVITVLCGVGLYTSLFMLRKSIRAARGELRGPSVVKTARAHLFGVPNSLLGSLYYPAVALTVWFVRSQLAAVVLLLAVFSAAAASVVLAYSLLFITRRECPFCWTSHAINWTLLVLCGWVFAPDVLSRGI
ncbi:MAG: vitamin K epoxide reductase family protein [Candidatus Cybelea sp.]